MIDWRKNVSVQRIKLNELVIGESLARDPKRVLEYAQLLLDHPCQDLGPMEVEPDPKGYVIRNGHHRFCAYIIAGRTHALCMVIR